MCGPKIQPPKPDPASEALAQDIEAQRKERKDQLAQELSIAKRRQTEEEIARYLGRYGRRSLIAGRKGGGGFGRPIGGQSNGLQGGGGSSSPSSPVPAGGIAPGAPALLTAADNAYYAGAVAKLDAAYAPNGALWSY